MAEPRFNPTLGPARLSLTERDADTIRRLEEGDVLVADERRSRSSYFDGRFLAARDLTREQTYALVRQADLSRAGGSGVVRGLDVRLLGPTTLQIAAGTGVTGTGELVTLVSPRNIAIPNIPDLQRLDLSSGVATLQGDNPAKRNGVFVLGLRPVEYSKRPITAYPTSVFGKRSQENGDIQEAVALVLAPLQLEGPAFNDMAMRRAELARKVFFETGTATVSPELLPLAMLQLDGGVVRWLDPYLARREVAAERSRVLGISLASRALREAHLLQYDAQLREVLAARLSAGKPRFAATEVFSVLPAVGRMPAAAIDTAEFTQFWFPPQMSVELAVVHEQELAALLEQQLSLPPLDLRGEAEDLDHTRVQVLIPLSSAAIGQLRLATSPRRLAALVPQLITRRQPREILAGLLRQQAVFSGIVGVSTAAETRQQAIDAAWKQALALNTSGFLWYVRARTLELSLSVLNARKDAKDGADKSGKEAKEAKETKETKDTKDTKETKEAKETKETKDNKDATKEGKEATKDNKDTKDATKETKEESKDTKDSKDGTKETKEQSKDTKDNKDAVKDTKEASKDTKDNKDSVKDTKEASKDNKDNKDSVKDTKEASKDNKDKKDAVKDTKEVSKDNKDTKESKDSVREKAVQVDKVSLEKLDRAEKATAIDRVDKIGLEKLGEVSTGTTTRLPLPTTGDRVLLSRGVVDPRPDVPLAGGVRAAVRPAPARTFIEPTERPAVGDRALEDDEEPKQ